MNAPATSFVPIPALQSLLDMYRASVIACSVATSLEHVQEAYTNYNSNEEEIFDLIHQTYTDSKDIELALALYAKVDDELRGCDQDWIPMFDPTLHVYEMYDDYEGYFQRYGLTNADLIVSWDESNVLFHDIESDQIEIIRRPDLLVVG